MLTLKIHYSYDCNNRSADGLPTDHSVNPAVLSGLPSVSKDEVSVSADLQRKTGPLAGHECPLVDVFLLLGIPVYHKSPVIYRNPVMRPGDDPAQLHALLRLDDDNVGHSV